MSRAMFPNQYKMSSQYQSYHFCFIWKRNTLLSVGTNNVEQENGRVIFFANKFKVPEMKRFPYIHAEIDAISKLWGRHHIDSSLKTVVIRINKDYDIRNSKPCDRCNSVLNQLGLTKKLWHSTDKQIVKWKNS